MSDETRREWSLAAAAALALLSLWGFHALCDAFVAGEIPSPYWAARGETVGPTRLVCWHWLGAVTWTGAAGLASLLAAWILPRLWTGAPARLVAALTVAGRLVALLLLGGLAFTAAVYGRFGA
ncbi:MAG: hypothetical protein R2991_05290 [Thermoanaerobaculia bacterium]